LLRALCPPFRTLRTTFLAFWLALWHLGFFLVKLGLCVCESLQDVYYFFLTDPTNAFVSFFPQPPSINPSISVMLLLDPPLLAAELRSLLALPPPQDVSLLNRFPLWASLFFLNPRPLQTSFSSFVVYGPPPPFSFALEISPKHAYKFTSVSFSIFCTLLIQIWMNPPVIGSSLLLGPPLYLSVVAVGIHGVRHFT